MVQIGYPKHSLELEEKKEKANTLIIGSGKKKEKAKNQCRLYYNTYLKSIGKYTKS